MVNLLRSSAFCIVHAVCLFITACSSDSTTSPATPRNNVPPAVEARVQRLTGSLKARGFEVSRGYVRVYTIDDCSYSYALMKSCYGNNPAAPYISFAVPSWPDEFVDPATRGAFGVTAEGYNISFRLDPREAIVIMGMLPPPAAYMGIQTYLFTREGMFDTNSSMYKLIAQKYTAMLGNLFSMVPNNPKRIQLLASLGNSNNNVIVERASGSAFGQERFFIVTPDRFMEDAVREALKGLPVEDAHIYAEPVPLAMRLGLAEKADEFLSVMRYAMPYDDGEPGSPSATWRKDLPLVVLRVRDTRQDRAPQPYGPPQLDARTAVDESSLKTDLQGLVAAVTNRWGQPCTQPGCTDRARDFIDMQTQLNLVGPRCMDIGMNCLGDTQDTTYQATVNLPLESGEVYAVVGTLGTETGNATYVGLSVNESTVLKGVSNVDSYQLENTAASYADKVNNTGRFFVYYFTRDCSGIEVLSGGNCLSVTDEMIPVCAQPGDPSCFYLKLIMRAYVKPGTIRGPASASVLQPKVVSLTRGSAS